MLRLSLIHILLNAYHAKVRETILPYLAGDEAEWLLHATREI